MSSTISNEERRNYEIFRDCLATALVEKISVPETKPRRRTKDKTRKKKTVSSASQDKAIIDGDDKNEDSQDPDPTEPSTVSDKESGDNAAVPENSNQDDLADFTEYIATETFALLPTRLKTVDYHDYTASTRDQHALPLTGADIHTTFPCLLDPSITDSLTAYGITDPQRQGPAEFLAPILTSFLTALRTPPPPPSATRADACEICARDWINLSYHHLIPRFVHAKAVKRGWHRACDLQNVAWLCGACHGFVHRFASHEVLARRFYTVELLCAEEEVRRWAAWVGRLRWKGK